jgi:hypothetical protein
LLLQTEHRESNKSIFTVWLKLSKARTTRFYRAAGRRRRCARAVRGAANGCKCQSSDRYSNKNSRFCWVFWFGSHPENLSFEKVSILVHPKKSTFFKTVFGLQHEKSCFCNVDFSANW